MDLISRYYSYQAQSGKMLPTWIWDKYILPNIKGEGY